MKGKVLRHVAHILAEAMYTACFILFPLPVSNVVDIIPTNQAARNTVRKDNIQANVYYVSGLYI